MLDAIKNNERTQAWMREITACRTQDEIDRKVAAIIAECERTEPPFLSDLILGISDGGQAIMIGLGDREKRELEMQDGDRFRWKIKVLRDEWGNKLQPGDVVERVVMKGLYKRDGIPVASTEMSRAKVDGSYKDRFENRYRYTVDDKGCVECGFTAAGYFLNVYGVHAITGYSLTTKPVHSTEPSKAPNGQMLHVWYWRYSETDAAMYDALPKIKKSDDPKRGLQN